MCLRLLKCLFLWKLVLDRQLCLCMSKIFLIFYQSCQQLGIVGGFSLPVILHPKINFKYIVLLIQFLVDI